MTFVDTSIWVDAFRVAGGSNASHLRDLLDSDQVALAIPVRIEILSGASRADRARLRRVLSALPVFSPVDATWTRMEEWVDRAGDAGERFGVGDLLVGSIAADRDGDVWSSDRDFARMARLGLVKLHVW
ncbi:MAG TPA: PIN domain-containing protein [Planctomycetota bacterium]|nr:PIN domain-containing protein [Planctomycetota bacterium]